MWRRGDFSTLLLGMQTGAGTVENMEFPQKVKMYLTHDPVITFREYVRSVLENAQPLLIQQEWFVLYLCNLAAKESGLECTSTMMTSLYYQRDGRHW